MPHLHPRIDGLSRSLAQDSTDRPRTGDGAPALKIRRLNGVRRPGEDSIRAVGMAWSTDTLAPVGAVQALPPPSFVSSVSSFSAGWSASGLPALSVSPPNVVLTEPEDRTWSLPSMAPGDFDFAERIAVPEDAQARRQYAAMAGALWVKGRAENATLPTFETVDASRLCEFFPLLCDEHGRFLGELTREVAQELVTDAGRGALLAIAMYRGPVRLPADSDLSRRLFETSTELSTTYRAQQRARELAADRA